MIIEGTGYLKSYRGEYDFAVDGGAVSTITLRSSEGAIPSGAVIMGGYLEVDTGFTSGGAGTAALSVEAAGDVVVAAAVSGAPWSTTGRKSIIPVFTGATTVKTTASRAPTIAFATAAITAGKGRLVLFYR
jgi:hypothetical protein